MITLQIINKNDLHIQFGKKGIGPPSQRASLIAPLVKNPLTMQETWVRSLGWEDPLEKGKATHSSILAWRVPWTSPWGRKESGTTERLSLHRTSERKQPGEQGRSQGSALEFNSQ